MQLHLRPLAFNSEIHSQPRAGSLRIGKLICTWPYALYFLIVLLSLYLDIWTPVNATKDSKLPVKVFVYGGSNTDGGISDSLYDGCHIAEDGAILVSINYRLGPFGFMALESAGIQGNQGIQDLLLGLQWVKHSISAFGGDSVRDVAQGSKIGRR